MRTSKEEKTIVKGVRNLQCWWDKVKETAISENTTSNELITRVVSVYCDSKPKTKK